MPLFSLSTLSAARTLLTQPLRLTQPGSLPRLFSSSDVLCKYKLKSHSGAKKRFKSIASGVFKRGKAGHSHLNASKRPGRKNSLGLTAYTSRAQTSKMKKLLPWA